MNASTTWKEVQENAAQLREGIAQAIVGQRDIVEEMIIALLCRGHCLIVGVPGLAKTLLVSTLAQATGLSFRRIQFTPDLMPMDILGSEILQDSADGQRRFEFAPGPIFANLILADEINRTPPKTQAALLEAMQEKQVTVAGNTLTLPEPFLVYATQNPIEHEGTYPLPEAQLDRFFFSLRIDYPSPEEEREVVARTTARARPTTFTPLPPAAVTALQEATLDVPLPDHVLDYILRLVRASRPSVAGASDYVRQYVAWGAGPRGAQNLARAAKARALLRGEPAAAIEDVRQVARPVLRHRIIPNYNATGEGVDVEQILGRLLEAVEAE